MASGPAGPDDDVTLVGGLVDGSEAALEIIYDRYAAQIHAMAYRMTSDRGLAEEVVQETFLALWNRAATFDPGSGSLGAWLHAIARNRAIDRLRAAGRRPNLISMTSFVRPDDDETGTIDRVVSGGTVVAGATPSVLPDDAVTSAEGRAILQLAVAAMPDAERTVILLAYRDGLSQREIADRLAWPLGTVKTRTRRALARLRAALGPEFEPVAGRDAGLDEAPVSAGDDRWD